MRLFPPKLSTSNKGHGRVETRSIEVARAPSYLRFPHARQVARVTRTRCLGGETSSETVYLITSLSLRKASPEQLLVLNRGHWDIENKLHYVRDVSFGEDRRHHRKNPTIFASFANLVINILRLLGGAFVPTWLRFFTFNIPAAVNVLGIS